MIPILLLAAGASRRMVGRDKLMETVDGLPLLLRQANLAAEMGGPVFVTLPDPDHARTDLLRKQGPEGVSCIFVPDARDGMSHSLKAGIAALPDGATDVLIMLADLPEIEASDLRALLHARRVRDDADVWRATTEDGLGGHPLILSSRLFSEVQALEGDTGAGDIISAAHKAGRLVPVPLPGQRARTDLDTPTDWAEWREANPDR